MKPRPVVRSIPPDVGNRRGHECHGRPLHEVLMAVERALIDFCEGDLADDVSILALRVLPLTLG